MQNFKHLFLPLIYILMNCGIIQNCSAQKKFDLGIKFNPQIVPININTYYESGPGYYDIKANGNVSQALYADFTYWQYPSLGVSLSMGVRQFSSEIQYKIPDPANEENGGLVYDISYPSSAVGIGPGVSILYRNNRFRGRLGYCIFDLSKEKYISINRNSSVTVFNGQETIADIQLDEISYWHTSPTAYGIYQLEGQYNIIKNLFLNVGFETTASGRNYYLYSLKISGFTENTPHENQVLNDFKMSHTYASFSVGVSYIIGFGSYKPLKIEGR